MFIGLSETCEIVSQSVCHGHSLHPSLVFVSKARSLPLEWSLVRGSTLVNSCLTCKYQTRVEVNRSDKHCSLLQCSNNFDHKKFYSTKRLDVTIKKNLLLKKYLQKSYALKLYRIHKIRVLLNMPSLNCALIKKIVCSQGPML